MEALSNIFVPMVDTCPIVVLPGLLPSGISVFYFTHTSYPKFVINGKACIQATQRSYNDAFSVGWFIMAEKGQHFHTWWLMINSDLSFLFYCLLKSLKISLSFEPELNQRPKDVHIFSLQSSALPAELSKVAKPFTNDIRNDVTELTR